MLDPSSSAANLSQLWRAGNLCDVTLRSKDGLVEFPCHFPCHRVVLAATSGYFRALFTGAGSAMLERASSTVTLMELSSMDLRAALEAMYELRAQVGCEQNLRYMGGSAA